MKKKALKAIATFFLIITVIAFSYSLYLILYYFDIIPNRNLGFLDISHLISGFVAGIGALTGLISFLFYRLGKKIK